MFLIVSLTLGLTLIPESLDSWLNYPGLELWKFANLLLFILAAIYLHRRFGRPVREALRARSEGIKRELEVARKDRDEALARLAEVEARFANLDAELAAVMEEAKAEAEAEKKRINDATDLEIAKIREQAKREIETAGKAAKHDLRRFAAQESVRLAEGIIVREISLDDDARLTNRNLEELGRTRA